MDLINSDLMEDNLFTLKGAKPVRYFYNADGDSESDAEGEPETENEDYVESDGEESEIGDTSQTDLPKFRTLVRNKKLELKAQYGKAHIVNNPVRKCTTIKVPEGYTERECRTVCTAWYILNRDGHRAGDCKADEQVCANVPKVRMIDQEVCINVPHFSWVSGWRKQWREFKRNGGLAQLKLESKGLLPTPTPTFIPPIPYTTYIPKTPTETEVDTYQYWSCQQLSNEFGNRAESDRPESAIKSWRNRSCNTVPTLEPSEPETDEEENNDNEEDTQDSRPSTKSKPKSNKMSLDTTDDKILGIPKDVAIGLGVAVLLIGIFALIRKKG